jgi:ANTH domain.
MKLRIPSSLSLALAISAIASHYSLLFVEAGSRSSAAGRGGAPSRQRGPPSSTVSSSTKRSSRKSTSSSRSRRSLSNNEGLDSDLLGEKSQRSRQRKQLDIQEDPDFGKIPGDESEIDYDVEDSRAYDEFDQNVLGSDGGLEEDEYLEQDDFYDDEFDEYREVGRSERGLRERQRGRSVGPPNKRVRPSSSDRRGSPRSGRGTPTRGGRSGGRRPNAVPSDRRRGGRVVPYGTAASARRGVPQPGAFARGLSALRESIPDPNAIKDTALQSLSAAKETTSKLSSNLYREIKGLTSSELEQVMLKATQPNDLPVKGKHVERLVGVTYQISGRYDIYDAVLRKLWSKMVEKDWRTTIKALYILHRFSADGAPDHQAALKARLRELRRTRDPKRKEKYFNSKQLLAGESTVSVPCHGLMLHVSI